MESAFKTIKRYNMLCCGDRVIVGVSGGPDSMALLNILHSLKDDYSLHIYACHINHMLRGEESDDDTKYVEEFCARRDIPCSIKYVDVKKMAEEWGLSHEEAGRKARYDFFSSVAKEIGATKIALAHNMNDQAETVLMRIMRGTGLEGLRGIKPVRDGFFIRPLIYTTRHEIEEYCRLNGLNPRTDSTNLKPIYARNKVRLELIPYIMNNYNPNIVNTLSSMAEIAGEDNDFIEGYVDKVYCDIASEKESSIFINIDGIKTLHIAVKKRILRRSIQYVKGDLNGIENKHIELILSILESALTGAAVELPGRIRARISYGNLLIECCSGFKEMKFLYYLPDNGEVYIKEINGIIKCEIIASVFNIYEDNRFVKYFDYDKIRDNLMVRSRKEGDYIIPLGLGKRKKIKEIFIDSKVPKEERDRVPIILCGEDIVWVVGYKMSDKYKVDKGTKRVLKIQFVQLGGKLYA